MAMWYNSSPVQARTKFGLEVQNNSFKIPIVLGELHGPDCFRVSTILHIYWSRQPRVIRILRLLLLKFVVAYCIVHQWVSVSQIVRWICWNPLSEFFSDLFHICGHSLLTLLIGWGWLEIVELSQDRFHEWFFHHNSYLMKISFCSHLNCLKVIAIKFCTWHDSCVVMACAKFCSNMITYEWVTLKPVFRRIWHMIEISWVKWARSSITSISVGKSFWNFAWSMVVSLPCSVLNFKIFQKLKFKFGRISYFIWTPWTTLAKLIR